MSPSVEFGLVCLFLISAISVYCYFLGKKIGQRKGEETCENAYYIGRQEGYYAGVMGNKHYGEK